LRNGGRIFFVAEGVSLVLVLLEEMDNAVEVGRPKDRLIDEANAAGEGARFIDDADWEPLAPPCLGDTNACLVKLAAAALADNAERLKAPRRESRNLLCLEVEIFVPRPEEGGLPSDLSFERTVGIGAGRDWRRTRSCCVGSTSCAPFV